MKLGICNFIFPKLSKEIKQNILQMCDYVDFAPTIENIKWNNNDKIYYDYQDIPISCLQSITYGVDNLSLVKSDNEFNNLKRHFSDVCKLATKLDAKGIIYGSPSTRREISVPKTKIYSRLLELTESAKLNNLDFFIEAVSTKFGNEYVCKTDELLKIVELEEKLNLHLDIGLIIEENFDLKKISNKLINKVKHIHLATPDLNLPNQSQIKVWFQIIEIFKQQNIPIVVEIQNIQTQEEELLLDLMKKIRGFIS